MKIAIISPTVPEDIRKIITVEDYYIIAVDGAVDALSKQGIDYQLAVGDFDSLENTELLKGEVIKLNPIKDDSDTAKALEIAFNKSNEVILIGGTEGARKDHFIANLMMLLRYPSLAICDRKNHISIKKPGLYSIEKKEYDYLSVFPIEDSLITLKNVKYPLFNYALNRFNPLGLSNEIIGIASLEVHQGLILLIQSKDKS